MHELSLAQALLSQLEQLATDNNASTVLIVRVDIGKDAGIVIDSFTFGFDAIKTEVALTKQAELIISETEGNDLILTRVEME
jgi:Zn finger protein HypA/HybF involved in hydrogenase expression